MKQIEAINIVIKDVGKNYSDRVFSNYIRKLLVYNPVTLEVDEVIHHIFKDIMDPGTDSLYNNLGMMSALMASLSITNLDDDTLLLHIERYIEAYNKSCLAVLSHSEESVVPTLFTTGSNKHEATTTSIINVIKYLTIVSNQLKLN